MIEYYWNEIEAALRVFALVGFLFGYCCGALVRNMISWAPQNVTKRFNALQKREFDKIKQDNKGVL